MTAREYRDSLRETYVQNEDLSPNRPIVYTRNVDDIPLTKTALVANSEFNMDTDSDKKSNTISFYGLVLDFTPSKFDKITYNSIVYKVREWVQVGNVFSFSAENEKRNKVTSRSFK
jgi:hypothetical protein